MAWRIAEQVTRGELDNRINGRVSGHIWLEGQAEPICLVLEGNPYRDWAGCVLRFKNPRAQSSGPLGLALDQTGVCGDMTASRKVRIPPEPLGEWLAQGAPGKDSLPWGNCVYLEWFSERNGRVVIESTRFEVEISERAWIMTEEEEIEQRERNLKALDQFLICMAKGLPRATNAVDASSSGIAVEEATGPGPFQIKAEIEKLKQQARDLAGGDLMEGESSPGLPLDLEHQFWKRVVAFESAPRKIRREILAEDGFQAPPEAGMSDGELSLQLWRLIEALAARRTFLEWTDHLSDRELLQAAGRTCLGRGDRSSRP